MRGKKCCQVFVLFCFLSISAEKKKKNVCLPRATAQSRLRSPREGRAHLHHRATVSLVPLLRELSVTTSQRHPEKKPKGHAGLP